MTPHQQMLTLPVDWDALATALAAVPRPVILIDGGSGSGKTWAAEQIATHWPDTAARLQVVSLDDVYPGWDGLAAGSAAVAGVLLRPDHPGFRRWNWGTSEPDGWVPIDPDLPILIEGCGTLTAANRALATAGLWCDLAEPERASRALQRDGATLAANWDRWARQETEHWRLHAPWTLADYVLRLG